MTVEFGASIKLDAAIAIQQMQRFASQTSKASTVLKGLQSEVKKATEALGANTFKKYVDSSRKLTLETKRNIAAIHDQTKTYAKLSDEQKELISVVDKLNQKYSEAARNEANLVRIKKELTMITGAGLQTRRQELAIYAEEAEKIRRSTSEYKRQQSEIKKTNDARRAEAKNLRDLRMRYDKAHSTQVRERIARMNLNKLLRKGTINGKEYTAMLKRQKIEIEHITSGFNRMAGAQSAMAKAARFVSIYSRVLLGVYTAIRGAKFYADLEKMAQNVDLLSQKLEFLTGDAGAYKKFFDMTQDVGIEMESANKIITRFAVVTNRTFSIDTMNEWSATLIKSARATGTSTQEMSGALIQITQAMSAGRLMGDEYRSVTENLPLLTVALRDIFGKSTLSLKELSSQGLLTNKVLIEGFGKLKEMLKGFPDSTDTIEASIGRLSSAWNDFIATALNATFTKDLNNDLTFIINFYKQKLQGEDFGLSNEIILEANEIRTRKAFEKENARLKKFRKIQKDSEGAIFGAIVRSSNQINIDKSKEEVNKLLDAYQAAQQAVVDYSNEEIADNKAQAIRDENKAFSERLKTIQLIERIEKGKTVFTIRQKAELERNQIKSKLDLFKEDESAPGGIDVKQAKHLTDTINKNEEDSIQKRYKTQVDAHLRLRGLKTNFNFEEIQNELSNKGKLLEIEKNFSKRKLEIESGMEARRIGLIKGLKGEALSGFTEEIGTKLLGDLETKKISDINTEVGKIVTSIEKLGLVAEKTTAAIKGDKLGLLDIQKGKIVNDFENSLESLDNKFEKLGERVDSTNKSYEEYLDSLEKTRDAELFAAGRDFDEKLEDKFSSAKKAAREYTDAINDLNDARSRSIVTSEEFVYHQRLINEEFVHQTKLAESLTGELSSIDQMYAGFNRGVESLGNNTETMYEAIAVSTEDLFGSMADVIVEANSSASDSFKELTQSILNDLQKIIIKQALVSAYSSIMGGGSSAPVIGGSVQGVGNVDVGFSPTSFVPSAKGNVFSGAGISKYSGSVISKPTVFAFANGAGIMGEDGEEAVMPLKRGKDGKLGVQMVSNGKPSSEGTRSVTVKIENIGGTETKIVESTVTTDIRGDVINIVLDDLRNGGPVRDSVKGLREYG